MQSFSTIFRTQQEYSSCNNDINNIIIVNDINNIIINKITESNKDHGRVGERMCFEGQQASGYCVMPG